MSKNDDLKNQIYDYLKLVGPQFTSEIAKHFKYIAEKRDPSWTRKLLHRMEKRGYIKLCTYQDADPSNYASGINEAKWMIV